MGTNTPRGMQPKADQAKLLRHPDETSHEYKIIEDSADGRILQKALEKLDQRLHEIIEDFEERITILENRGALAFLNEDGDQVEYFANGFISDEEPDFPIQPMEENGGDPIDNVQEGDIWFDTKNNVVRIWNGTKWKIKGAAYL